MRTGWQWLEDKTAGVEKLYYFNTINDGKRVLGSLARNEMIGTFQVNENGECTIFGVVQTRSISKS